MQDKRSILDIKKIRQKKIKKDICRIYGLAISLVFLLMLVMVQELPALGAETDDSYFVKKDGVFYYYDGEGQPVKDSWFTYEGDWYYADVDGGLLADKLFYWKGGRYYLDRQCVMAVNAVKQVDGELYYFGPTGRMMKNRWVKQKKKWYYAGETGAFYRDKVFTVGGKQYYADENGVMAENAPVYADGEYYYAGKGGAFVTGSSWISDGDDWYFTDGTGKLVTNAWKKVRGAWYYFKEDATMAREETALWEGKTLYYLTESGKMHTGAGWITAGDKQYLSDAAGRLSRNVLKAVGEDYYYFGADGVGVKSDNPLVAEVAAEMNLSLYQAFKYAMDLNYFGKYSFDESWGTKKLARQGIEKGGGNCYVYAGVFCALAREMGYEARQMSGHYIRENGTVASHSWVEILMDGKTYVYDPESAHRYSTYNYYKFSYGAEGTLQYSDYHRMKDEETAGKEGTE